ncbi:MAG: hypothetical protein DM484_15570 [Candidatus Methylumidiphilus alinenensis]|uniref:Uncharacterized protein n=1 Tax=Candidatus Methylumidiphilus alinenensis TaxID=2202197 RepID=A0A2W4R1E6_9GAMM|nr:MAG: hypothetical protein DM484_15570 [Candidatus Methylumidiphilus alinenensis]
MRLLVAGEQQAAQHHRPLHVGGGGLFGDRLSNIPIQFAEGRHLGQFVRTGRGVAVHQLGQRNYGAVRNKPHHLHFSIDAPSSMAQPSSTFQVFLETI